MKSPFAGMDPFIESFRPWGDFHSHLIERLYDAISDDLPTGYISVVSERSYIVCVDVDEKDERHFVPDVKVTAPRSTSRQAGEKTAPQDEGAVTLRAFIEEDFVERFIDIYELEPEHRLVTSIEILSPSNKKSGTKGWDQYLRKRQALLLGEANLVELDLLRGGTRMPMLDPWPPSPHYVLVARRERAPRCRVWPAYSDRPLPTFPVPLQKKDADIRIALQPLVDAIYKRGRYWARIDYTKPIEPPLSVEETAAMKRQLAESQSELPPSPRRRKRQR